MPLGRRFYEGEDCMICNKEIDQDDVHRCAVMKVDEPKLIACGPCIEEALRETFGNDLWTEVGL